MTKTTDEIMRLMREMSLLMNDMNRGEAHDTEEGAKMFDALYEARARLAEVFILKMHIDLSKPVAA
jgi:hypothetical protein